LLGKIIEKFLNEVLLNQVYGSFLFLLTILK